MANSSASRVVNYSQLSPCQGDMQPFEGDLYTRGRLTRLRNKPQQKQPGQLSASLPGWIVSQRVQLLFDGEKCVLLLWAWKPAFLRSGHNYALSSWATEQKFDLKNNSMFKNFHHIFQETKILYHEQFSHENIQQWILQTTAIKFLTLSAIFIW